VDVLGTRENAEGAVSAGESDQAEHGRGEAAAHVDARGGRRGVGQPEVAWLATRQSCNEHIRRWRTHLVRLVDESSQTPGPVRCAVRPRREHG
jgi:hypothetical protein